MNRTAFQQLQAIVVDWAGTIVDHGSLAPAIVFQEIFRKRGVEITIDEARGPMGRSKREHIADVASAPRVARAWTEKYGAPPSDADVDALYAEFMPLQKATLEKYSHLIPGVAETMSRLAERGLAIGSTTGYTRELMEVVLPAAEAQGWRPDVLVCSDDVENGRPAPWMLLTAAERLGVFPTWRVVKVDDTAPGLQAARAAGAWAVGVSRTGNGVGLSVNAFEALSDDEQCEAVSRAADVLDRAGAHFVIESAADIESVLDEIETRLEAGERPEAIDHR